MRRSRRVSARRVDGRQRVCDPSCTWLPVINCAAGAAGWGAGGAGWPQGAYERTIDVCTTAFGLKKNANYNTRTDTGKTLRFSRPPRARPPGGHGSVSRQRPRGRTGVRRRRSRRPHRRGERRQRLLAEARGDGGAAAAVGRALQPSCETRAVGRENKKKKNSDGRPPWTPVIVCHPRPNASGRATSAPPASLPVLSLKPHHQLRSRR